MILQPRTARSMHQPGLLTDKVFPSQLPEKLPQLWPLKVEIRMIAPERLASL
jgi:hypothetical protein